MEYVPGRSLGRIIADEAMSLERALGLFEQILSALGAIHRCGIVHADVKSDNFIVERVDGADHVTMIDFGLAEVLGGAYPPELASDEVSVSGTPEYLAPEVIAGDTPLPASDLYGAGVILYELLTGSTPFCGGTANEIMARHVREPVIPPSERARDRGIPPEIDRVVLEALDKHPDARFRDAAAFAHALKAAAGAACGPDSHSGVPEDSALATAGVDTNSRPTTRQLARTSDASDASSGELEAPRRAIEDAIRTGDIAAIADGYLALANALVERHQVARAMRELQEGIDIVTEGGNPCGGDSPSCVDRLVIALAALYDDEGDPRHARHLAMSTDRSPTRTYAIR
jgi:serine/threonine protein kinase